MPNGRFAPSPTGPLHLGNLRTALVAWLVARSAESEFYLRIEDLDPVASDERWVDEHLADLVALGLDVDGEIWRQSDRRDAHDSALAQLERAGLLYECFCTRREVLEAAAAPHGPAPEGAYPGTCRNLTPGERTVRRQAGRRPALRLRAGGAVRSFVDAVAGPVNGVVDDFVVRRADGVPAYNLAVVVDDAAQGVEQVVRGDDLLLTTPRQLLVSDLLGLPTPSYVHVPLALGPDGQRLAKRDGSVTLADRRDAGDSPADVLALLAVSLDLIEPGESVSAGDLVARFDLRNLPTKAWSVPRWVLSGQARDADPRPRR